MEDRYSKENIKRIRPFLSECCVLLKKDDSFPLDGPCRIACFGSGVFDTVKGGTGSATGIRSMSLSMKARKKSSTKTLRIRQGVIR